MKYLVLILAMCLTACGPSPQPTPKAEVKPADEEGCVVESGSKLVNQHKVSAIRNLVKDKEELGAMGRCTVNFDITVDGKDYHLEETEEGLEQLESLCYYARKRAREDLLLDLGGDFQSESSVSCKQRD